MPNHYWTLQFDEQKADIEYTEQEDLQLQIQVLENKSQEIDTVELGNPAPSWQALKDKPFERIGKTLAVQEGTLEVNIHEILNEAGGVTLIIGEEENSYV